MREARGPGSGRVAARARASSRSSGVDTRSLGCTCATGARCEAPSSGTASRATALAAVRGEPSMAGAALAAARLDRAAVRLLRSGDVRVAVVDYGAKRSILRRLAAAGAAVTVFPHDVDAGTLAGFDGVVLSNGPGDPAAARRRGRDGARAARPRAGARDLPRPPAARARDRPRRRSSCRSATAARTTRCSSARPAACS